MHCYDAFMRTTVDLPPVLFQRVKQLARREQSSVSATVARLTAERMDMMDSPALVRADPVSAFPTISIGQPLSSAQVADLIDEDQ